MGKRNGYRFPRGINEIDRYYFPHPLAQGANYNGNVVTDLFADSGRQKSNFDVLGSYTGVTKDNSYPIQDADDL